MADVTAVQLSDQAGVLIITLNRPEVRNAVNAELATELAAAMDRLDDDASLRVGVITGAGKGFCAGMDLKAFAAGVDAKVTGRGFAGIVEHPSSKPLIAAVEGFAVAGGLEIALACDMIVAGRRAKLGLPEAKRSLVPAAGGLLRLPRRIGYGATLTLALTGDLVDAERGFQIGLVDELCDDGAALPRAVELARTIAANGPLALAAIKEICVRERDWQVSEWWSRQAEIAEPVQSSRDAREGALAFTEKRAPIWNS